MNRGRCSVFATLLVHLVCLCYEWDAESSLWVRALSSFSPPIFRSLGGNLEAGKKKEKE